jgi:hypothetical protein
MPLFAPLRRSCFGIALATLLALPAVASPSEAASPQAQNKPIKTLRAFSSERALIAYLRKRQKPPAPASKAYGGLPMPAPAAAAPEAAASLASDSITNTQEAGVDEGGIVKTRGDLLIVLRRGRLFTISMGKGELQAVDSIDAFPPGVDPRGDWYDEMLIAGNRVIVIGYSYARGGTEINRFRLDDRGQLAYEDTYHLRSNDYYSSRNYASRLIGTRLVVYSPLYLPWNAAENLNWWPGVRRWNSAMSGKTFERTAPALNIYMPPAIASGDVMPAALHAVTSCDLAAEVLKCRSTGVFGGSGRTFYVSSQAVYIWVTGDRWRREVDRAEDPSGLLYRLPLDGSAPSAMGVRGVPTDQFSFREDWNAGRLHVLIRSEGGGDAMWSPEFASGAVSLLTVNLAAFNDGSAQAPRAAYRMLPLPSGDRWAFQNRFVGDRVLYGLGSGWGRSQGQSTLVVAPVDKGEASIFPLQHGVDRIEAMGRDAVVIGGDGRDLHFQAIELTDGPAPRPGDRYTMPGASQGETRSHAFFFRPETGTDRSAGLMGLPVTRAGRPGYGQLAETSASIVFVRRNAQRFSPLGTLDASEGGVIDDGCRASCVDWYGNSRPIFIGNRTFALMGYELVEGEVSAASIRTLRRISFAPRRAQEAR